MQPLTPLKEESTPDYNTLELSLANPEEISILYQARVNECSKLINENTILRLKLEDSAKELLNTKSDFEKKMVNLVASLTATEKLLGKYKIYIMHIRYNYNLFCRNAHIENDTVGKRLPKCSRKK